MSDNESDSSGPDVVHDWTLVNEFGDVESDESLEAVNIESSEAVSFVSNAKPRSSLLTDVQENLDLVGDDGQAAVNDICSNDCELVNSPTLAEVESSPTFASGESNLDSSSSAAVPHLSLTTVDETCENAGTKLVVNETAACETPPDSSRQSHDFDSLSSGSSIELLEIPDYFADAELSARVSVVAEVEMSHSDTLVTSDSTVSSDGLSSITTATSTDMVVANTALEFVAEDGQLQESSDLLGGLEEELVNYTHEVHSHGSESSGSLELVDDVQNLAAGLDEECSDVMKEYNHAEYEVYTSPTLELLNNSSIAKAEKSDSDDESTGSMVKLEMVGSDQIVTPSSADSDVIGCTVDNEPRELAESVQLEHAATVEDHDLTLLDIVKLVVQDVSSSDEQLSGVDDIEAVRDAEPGNAVEAADTETDQFNGVAVAAAAAAAAAAEIRDDHSHQNQPEFDGDDADENEAATEDMVDDINIDDRCESDISGVATDDGDLSSVSGMGDVALMAETAIRSYRHQPNAPFNSALTCITITVVLFAIGIGIGHYIGSTRISALHRQQLARLHALQDEYFVCMNRLDNQEAKLQSALNMEQTITTISGAWQQKYEELVLEQAHLMKRLDATMQQAELTAQEATYFKVKTDESHGAVKSLADDVIRLSAGLAATNRSLRRTLELRRRERIASSKLRDQLETSKGHWHSLYNEMKACCLDISRNQSRANESVAFATNHSEAASISEQQEDGGDGWIDVNELKNTVNRLMTENEDLKVYVRNQRYTDHSRHLSKTDDVTTGGSTEAPRHHSGHYERQRESGHTESPTRGTSTKDESLIPELVRLLQMLGSENTTATSESPAFLSLVMHMVTSTVGSVSSQNGTHYGRAVHQVAGCVEALKHATGPRQSLLDILMLPWTQINKTGIVGFDNCEMFVSRESSETKSGCPGSADGQNTFSLYVNKTFTTISKLSSAIQKTLDRLKRVPKKLFVDSKATKKIAEKLSGAVTKLEDKIRTGWNSLHGRFTKTANEKTESKGREQGKHRRPSDEKKTDDKKRESLKDRVINGVYKVGKQTESLLRPVQEKLSKLFGRLKPVERPEDRKRGSRPGHDQFGNNNDDNDGSKHASSGGGGGEQRSRKAHSDKRYGPLKYEDFWHGDRYDPDDYLPDGFFEGNQRKWRQQHEERLRNIYGRLQRLTEAIFMSMDDDDVEDLHETLEDFAEDTEGPDEPVKFRTWISCQVRWWKSRLHRKHRAEDIVIGCGQQLMHWQLHVICSKPQSDTLKHACQRLLSPSSPSDDSVTAAAAAASASHVHLRDRKGSRNVVKADVEVESSYNKPAEASNDGESSRLHDDDDDAHDNKTCLNQDESSWYFRLAQHREDSHQRNPEWYFDMMDDRENHRGDANWYIRSMYRDALPRYNHQLSSSHAAGGGGAGVFGGHHRYRQRNF